MKPTLFPCYIGPLSANDVAKGIKAAHETARGLLADAILLSNQERWARAIALSLIAIEEIGKVRILREILLVDDAKVLERLWDDYYSHEKKNLLGKMLDNILLKEVPNEFKKIEKMKANMGKGLDYIKQLTLYSHRYSNEWGIPEKIAIKENAVILMAWAFKVVPDRMPPFCLKESLELWKKHMKPVFGRKKIERLKALKACIREGQETGILDEGDNEEELIKYLLEGYN